MVHKLISPITELLKSSLILFPLFALFGNKNIPTRLCRPAKQQFYIKMVSRWINYIFIMPTLKKKSAPAGRIIRCESDWSSFPFLYHSTVGCGSPSAIQFSVTGSCRGTTTSNGCSVILGNSNAATDQIN